MKIQSSSVSMSGSSKSTDIHVKQERLRTWVGKERPDFEGGNSPANSFLSGLKLDTVEISEQAIALLSEYKCSTEEIQKKQVEEITEISDKDKQKLLMLQKMLEALTGKKIKFYIPKKIKLDNTALGKIESKSAQNPSGQIPVKQGWGLEYDYHEFNYEQQQMSFTSSGVIKAEDGREISFSIQLNMNREFISRTDLTIRAGDAVMKDPLVINFDGSAPDLTDTKYAFDLDSDGSPDQISFITEGSGFLALDLNGDGIINNGGELFGPGTGNGFAELAGYDHDHNNWIDENDEIFNRLRIWTKDADGSDRLLVLGEKGIGAIYLGNVVTPFEFKNSGNDLQGQLKSTGIFIREDGTAGTVQQVDLAV